MKSEVDKTTRSTGDLGKRMGGFSSGRGTGNLDYQISESFVCLGSLDEEWRWQASCQEQRCWAPEQQRSREQETGQALFLFGDCSKGEAVGPTPPPCHLIFLQPAVRPEK